MRENLHFLVSGLGAIALFGVYVSAKHLNLVSLVAFGLLVLPCFTLMIRHDTGISLRTALICSSAITLVESVIPLGFCYFMPHSMQVMVLDFLGSSMLVWGVLTTVIFGSLFAATGNLDELKQAIT